MAQRPITIVSHDSGADRWSIAEGAPASDLFGIVDRYSGWRESTGSFTTRRELATTAGVFIVNLGAPLEIVDACGETHRFGAGEGFVGGMAQATSLSRSTGAMHGVHVFLPVDRLCRLMNVPLAELAERVISLDELLGDEADALGERLLAAGDDEARFTVLDQFAAARATRIERSGSRLSAALHLLACAGARR